MRGTPQVLFQTAGDGHHDVAKDDRFAINTKLDTTTSEPIHLLLNWKLPARESWQGHIPRRGEGVLTSVAALIPWSWRGPRPFGQGLVAFSQSGS